MQSPPLRAALQQQPQQQQLGSAAVPPPPAAGPPSLPEGVAAPLRTLRLRAVGMRDCVGKATAMLAQPSARPAWGDLLAQYESLCCDFVNNLACLSSHVVKNPDRPGAEPTVEGLAHYFVVPQCPASSSSSSSSASSSSLDQQQQQQQQGSPLTPTSLMMMQQQANNQFDFERLPPLLSSKPDLDMELNEKNIINKEFASYSTHLVYHIGTHNMLAVDLAHSKDLFQKFLDQVDAKAKERLNTAPRSDPPSPMLVGMFAATQFGIDPRPAIVHERQPVIHAKPPHISIPPQQQITGHGLPAQAMQMMYTQNEVHPGTYPPHLTQQYAQYNSGRVAPMPMAMSLPPGSMPQSLPPSGLAQGIPQGMMPGMQPGTAVQPGNVAMPVAMQTNMAPVMPSGFSGMPTGMPQPATMPGMMQYTTNVMTNPHTPPNYRKMGRS
ncbi:hypothetical protein Pelo_12818 [Pelomyxa schiedti]|nr:hypothetical protein Pelo_12818 [Pelomyxa schiedti]